MRVLVLASTISGLAPLGTGISRSDFIVSLKPCAESNMPLLLAFLLRRRASMLPALSMPAEALIKLPLSRPMEPCLGSPELPSLNSW